MKYETHGLTRAEEDKTNPSELVNDVVRWRDEPMMICWGDFTERLSDGRSWIHRCMREGDFTKTLGLCPNHYEEIVDATRSR